MGEPRDLKYVIVLSHHHEVPIVFPVIVAHDSIVNAMTTIVSAGFCRLYCTDGRWTVMTFGESETLGRRSRPEDNEIIRRHLFGNV